MLLEIKQIADNYVVYILYWLYCIMFASVFFFVERGSVEKMENVSISILLITGIAGSLLLHERL